MPHALETFRKHPAQGTFAHVLPTRCFEPVTSSATRSLAGLDGVCFGSLGGSRRDVKVSAENATRRQLQPQLFCWQCWNGGTSCARLESPGEGRKVPCASLRKRPGKLKPQFVEDATVLCLQGLILHWSVNSPQSGSQSLGTHNTGRYLHRRQDLGNYPGNPPPFTPSHITPWQEKAGSCISPSCCWQSLCLLQC